MNNTADTTADTIANQALAARKAMGYQVGEVNDTHVAQLLDGSEGADATLRSEAAKYLESEIRAVCEPIFDRPLKEISLGKVLVQLFKASRRFNVEIQPQLVLLQKTLLNVEGLGRQLDPNLDLWVTAKPFLERWMRDQIGWRAFERRLRDEAPFLMTALPLLPRLLHNRLSAPPAAADVALKEFAAVQRARNRWLAVVAVLLAGLIALLLMRPL